MASIYYVTCYSNGEIDREFLTRESLERRLNEKFWGEDPVFFASLEEDDRVTWRSLGCRSGLLIIKGEVIVPVAKEVVTRFELP